MTDVIADVLTCARLRGARSQAAFDVLLRAIAEPGTIHRLPGDLLHPDIHPPLWLALALADVDVSVAVPKVFTTGSDTAVNMTESVDPGAQLVHDATGARIVQVDDADIVILSAATPADLVRIRTGDALAPERGARLALPVTSFGIRVAGSLKLRLHGPGIDGNRNLVVDGLARPVAGRLGRESGAFPAGFDTWLFTDDGAVVALPRSTYIEIEDD